MCILASVAAVVFHLGLILFRTGSMSPEIPAGAVALVRQIPATDAHVGDVVTVDRPGALPVTHRVVSTHPLGGDRAELVLRGDANPQNDPAPYRVATVRIVLWSMPGGAQLIGFLSSPLFLGTATLGATALVAWAFWPRRDAGDEDGEPGAGEADQAAHTQFGSGHGPSNGGGEPAVCEADNATSTVFGPGRGPSDCSGAPGANDAAQRAPATFGPGSGLHHREGDDAAVSGRAGRGLPGLAVAGLAAGVALAALGVPGDAAHAAETTTTGRYITLTSVGDPAVFAALAPGATVRWQVGVAADPPTPATIRVGLASEGDGAAALTLTVRTCDTRWVGARCPGTARTLVEGRPASTFRTTAPGVRPGELDALASTGRRWLAVDVTLATAAPAAGASARLTVWAWGAGDDEHTGQETLPSTGSATAPTPLLLAGAAVVGGAALAGLARRRRGA